MIILNYFQPDPYNKYSSHNGFIFTAAFASAIIGNTLISGDGVCAQTKHVHPYIALADQNSLKQTKGTDERNVNDTDAVNQDKFSNKENDTETDTDQPDTIIVVGTHIRGAAPAGSNIEMFTRQDLERFGHATIQDFMNNLPQNFQGGGGSEEPANGALSSSNQMSGSSVNLRGLGSDSTLILINGRRVPQSGLEGNFVDISLLPQSAIDRIEILTDGASALYGSDAVGGVVNFVLRKDYEGAETRVRYGRATEGHLDEFRFSQTYGVHWRDGNALISYEYYNRDKLTYGERDFISTADLRSRGGSDLRTHSSNPGNILDPATFQPAYAIPGNQNGRDLTIDRLLRGQVNLEDRNQNETFLPRQRRHSIFAVAEHSVSEWLTLFAEGRYSERKSLGASNIFSTTLLVPATNPFYVNPFGAGPVWVSYSFEPELGLSRMRSRIRSSTGIVGGRIDLNSWRWETYGTYGRESSRQEYKTFDTAALGRALANTDPATALNVFGQGVVNNPETLATLTGDVLRKPRFKLANISSVADGPLLSIGDRQLSIAIGIDYRSEKFKAPGEVLQQSIFEEKFSRKIYAAFAEIHAPLIEADDNYSFLHSAELSLAGRIDDYSDVGTTTNPKIGLRIEPMEGFAINASYGTSFRAPNLTERTQSQNQYLIAPAADPQSGNNLVRALILTGNDPNLRSESSKTWTIGTNVRPETINGLQLQVNYFRTRFSDRIDAAGPPQFLLPMEELYANLITRNPSQSTLDEFCGSNAFIGNISECRAGLVPVIIDSRLRNMATSIVRGLDGSINYSFPVGPWSIQGGLLLRILSITYTSKQKHLHNLMLSIQFSTRLILGVELT